ncbi:hypothetical protein EST38_g5260 [Candolleomyces aberdarensis]|uniref:Uncharacterized protein n=1 Tax=Candolleomyces aberdarensis TaxID=2316362 RepID=A0A4Q2DN07_9AGAR|nr:hypothetical protein EST38_g5260 [Candolleomyces aberdarensis]
MLILTERFIHVAHSIPLMPPTWRIVNASATNSPNASDSAATISQNVSKTPKFRSLSEQDKPGSKVATPEVSEAELSALSLKLDNFSLHPPQPEPSASPSDLPLEIRKQIAEWRALYGTIPTPTAATGATKASHQLEASSEDEDFVSSDRRASLVASVEQEKSSLKDKYFDLGSDPRPSSAAGVELESSLKDEDFDLGSDRASPAASVESEESSLKDKDFDLGSDCRPSPAAKIKLEESLLKDEDFDLGSDRASLAASVDFEESSLKDEDFDLGSDCQPSPAASLEYEESSLKDEDFDLGSDSRPSPVASAELESSLKDEDFDIGSSPWASLRASGRTSDMEDQESDVASSSESVDILNFTNPQHL